MRAISNSCKLINVYEHVAVELQRGSTDLLVHLLQAMFWSGANELVHNVVCVKDDLVTLEDTMPG